MPIERVEQRVLGALRLIDRVTRTPITSLVRFRSENARVVRNRHGLFVVTEAKGLAAHTEAFAEPPDIPALESIAYTFEIYDPQERYLPRVVVLRLPRDPDPANSGHANSLFRPFDVALYPAGTAKIAYNWSTIRVSVSQGVDPQAATPVRGALLMVLDKADDTLLASGISDERGEALVVVPGVPVTKFADEADGHGHGHGHGAPPVIVTTLPVRLELSLAPVVSWPLDPDVTEQNHAANRRTSIELTLRTGRMEKVAINLT